MLYLIRHGRTDWNDLNKIQGSTDIKLNSEGINMAKEASIKYKDVHFDICYTSKLNRAIETAHLLLNNRNIDIIEDERLNEFSFGIEEGSIISFNDTHSITYKLFNNPKEYIKPENGESLDDLFNRVNSFLDDIIYPKLKENKDILIVSHGIILSAIMSVIENVDTNLFLAKPIHNCELITYDIKGND